MSRPLFLLLMAFAALIQFGRASWQYSDTVGDFAYTATYDQTAGGAYEGTARITGYTGSATNVVIPSTVSFTANPSGQNVTVNCTVTAIQQNYGQPGVFKDKAFITSVSLPTSLRSIGSNSFSYCTGLATLFITPNVTSIEDGAFAYCTGLTSVSIPESVSFIGQSAFVGCVGLTNVVIPEGVTSIGISAFRDCTGLVSVHIPSSITYMGHNTYGRQGTFDGCSNLETVTIGRGAEIGNDVFYNCKKLAIVTYVGLLSSGNSSSIGSYAFGGCSSLTMINLPNNLVSIGEGAFSFCTSLTSLTIPSSLIVWGHGAFSECKGLTSVTLEEGLKMIAPDRNNGYTFDGCSNLANITIPSSVTSIGTAVFRHCTSLSAVHIPENVTSIGDSAFSGCTSLTTVSIPENVTSIGDSAFSGCTGVTSATFPSNATTVGNTFSGCTSLASIVIPNGVTSIGYNAFSSCFNLADITFPPGIISIGDGAFSHCESLTSVVIPAAVQSIGIYAFYHCENLDSAFFQGPAPETESTAFEYSPVTIYYKSGAFGFTSPTWQGYPAFIAAPYGGLIPNLAINEAHLIGGFPADGNVRLEASVTDIPLLWQRQTTPVTLDMESSRVLRLGATGTVRVEAGDGALNIGKTLGDGFLTAGGAANSPGTLILDNTSSNDITVNAVIANNGSGAVGLSKTGSGRAILNASNTYSGNTTVTGGMLSLKSACLADASTVSIASGANFELDYNGTDIVTGLTLGGTAQANGVYDSTNTGGLITGTGRIQVGAFASYSAWVTANAPGQAMDQDHDHDGVANGVEYFIGKTGNDFTANLGITPNGTVTWPKSPVFNGSYAVETSTDLQIWTDVTEDAAQVTKNSDSVIWNRPTGPGSRFVRLVVLPN